MNTAIIAATDVNWKREQKVILKQIEWTVQKGEHWAILGLNGSGKTSLLKMIMGYEWPSQGTISVLGKRFGQTNIPELRKSIGWVSSSFDERFVRRGADTAIEVILSGKHASVGIFEEITAEDIAKAEALLQQLKIEHLRDQLFTTLSQGERRRVMIGRALFPSPQLLILDEPCSGLDIFMKEQLLIRLTKLVSLRTVQPSSTSLTTLKKSFLRSPTLCCFMKGE